MAPTIVVDAALAFIFYKLSVVSSELHRRRKSNSLITRLKFGTAFPFSYYRFSVRLQTVSIKKSYMMHKVIEAAEENILTS